MINTSSQYKAALLLDSPMWHGKATITFPYGEILEITNEDIMSGGIEIDDGTSEQGTFEVGSAIINQLTLTLNNFSGKFDDYDFFGATIVPYAGLELPVAPDFDGGNFSDYASGVDIDGGDFYDYINNVNYDGGTFGQSPDGSIEWLRKGFFTVDDPVSYGSTIEITALDNMSKFDRPYSESTLTYPATVLQILSDACTHCGVSLRTVSFINSDYSVKEKPTDTMTFREVVSYVAQLAGCYARINNSGSLELGWYPIDLTLKGSEADLDGGGFIDYASGDDADGGTFTNYQNRINHDGGWFLYPDGNCVELSSLSSCKVQTEDVRVTGVQLVPVDEKATTYLKGQSGYVVSIENNPLAQDNLEQLVVNAANKLVDFTFRPLEISSVGDPSIEAGDVAVVAFKGNKYATIVSNLHYVIGNYEDVSGDAESVSAKNSTRYSASAKAVQTSKNITEQKLTAYDVAVKQLTSLMTNAMGFYSTSVVQTDGSTIDYMHDKPLLSESRIIWKKSIDGFAVSTDGGITYQAGITADGNAVIKVLTALGINADWINAGTINAERLNLTDYAKFSNLSTPGQTIIVGDNITTGKIQGPNGKFFLDLDTGDSAVQRIVDDEGNTYLRVREPTHEGGYKYVFCDGVFDAGSNQIRCGPISCGSISASDISASNMYRNQKTVVTDVSLTKIGDTYMLNKSTSTLYYYSQSIIG